MESHGFFGAPSLSASQNRFNVNGFRSPDVLCITSTESSFLVPTYHPIVMAALMT